MYIKDDKLYGVKITNYIQKMAWTQGGAATDKGFELKKSSGRKGGTLKKKED